MDENRPHLDTATLKHGGPKIKSKPSEETELGEQQVDGRASPPGEPSGAGPFRRQERIVTRQNRRSE